MSVCLFVDGNSRTHQESNAETESHWTNSQATIWLQFLLADRFDRIRELWLGISTPHRQRTMSIRGCFCFTIVFFDPTDLESDALSVCVSSFCCLSKFSELPPFCNCTRKVSRLKRLLLRLCSIVPAHNQHWDIVVWKTTKKYMSIQPILRIMCDWIWNDILFRMYGSLKWRCVVLGVQWVWQPLDAFEYIVLDGVRNRKCKLRGSLKTVALLESVHLTTRT